MEYIRKIRYFVIACIAFLVVGFYATVTFSLSFMGPVQRALKNFSMTDIYTQILQSTGAPDTSRLITIVDMSDLVARRDLAEALEEILAASPKAVGVDMVFEGLKADTAADEWLTQIAETHDNVVWSMKLLDYDPLTQAYQTSIHSFFAEQTHPREGNTGMPHDQYERLRRNLPVGDRYGDEVLPSFVLGVARLYAGDEVMPLAAKDVAINFRPTEFPCLHASEVADHPELIEDRIVLFGAMHDEIDWHETTLGKMPGVELLAYSVQTLVNQERIRNAPSWLMWVVSFVIVMLTSWGLTVYKARQRRRWKSPFMFTLMTSLMVVGYIKFVWMALLTFVGFMLYNFFSVNINLGWAFSAIAFLATGEGFYKVLFEPEKNQ